MLALGMGMITDDLEAVDITPAARLFSRIAKTKLRRPMGQVDLLISIHVAEIHPIVADAVRHKSGNLRMLTLQFGSGFLLDGSHETIAPHGGKLCNLAYDYTRGTNMMSLASGMMPSYPEVRSSSIDEVYQKKIINLNHLPSYCTQFNFLEAEELGVGQPRLCGTCSNCQRCSV